MFGPIFPLLYVLVLQSGVDQNLASFANAIPAPIRFISRVMASSPIRSF
jgi:hypothetical protein